MQICLFFERDQSNFHTATITKRGEILLFFLNIKFRDVFSSNYPKKKKSLRISETSFNFNRSIWEELPNWIINGNPIETKYKLIYADMFILSSELER